ncbi:SGNH/GDSL hydrolase family protein [Fodinicola acaciae]|uniref:SGNH/GDSL hydrolase family protein n=1 Tax=Fodinicola acaciae TaxID=2681555 RepID=UPI0013D53694|nr:SGNH/GDSL hydrolase family protein [Fodinicola acaciae]
MSIAGTFRTLAAACLAAAGLVAFAGPVQAATNYVALGDSYSSGTGAGTCGRTTTAYPAVYADKTGATLNFQACSGAKTGDVLNNQVGALTASTNLVSITIGGNDAGFANILISCLLGGDSGCKSATDRAKTYIHDTLPGQLDQVYAAIRSHAPNAKVVVLSYPHIFTLAASCPGQPSQTSRGYGNSVADALATTTQSSAAKAGFTFSDARTTFAGHEICSSDPYLDGGNYHPNVNGHAKGYVPALEAGVG